MTDEVKNDLTVDGYQSLVTGLGQIGADRSESITFVASRDLPYTLIDNVYAKDALARRIIDVPVTDMFREGYQLKFFTNEDEPVDAEEQLAIEKELKKWKKKTRIDTHLVRHIKQSRAYGGALLYLGVDDGSPLDQPLRLDNIRSFDYVYPLDRFQVVPSNEVDTDPLSENFGLPVAYRIGDGVIPQDGKSPVQLNNITIHASRFIRTDGLFVSDRLRKYRSSWGISVIENIWDPLRNYNVAMKSINQLLQDLSVPVYKVNGLREAISAHQQWKVINKFRLIDQVKSMWNALVLDKDGEEYERRDASIAGISEAIKETSIHLAAASGMPITLLFGVSPGGFGTGEAEGQNWDDVVAGMQSNILQPILEKIFTVALNASDFFTFKGTWEIFFHPLQQMSDLQQADLQNKQMATDTGYVVAGILSPDEVANSRFGGEKYSLNTTLDMKSRGVDLFNANEMDIPDESADPADPVAPINNTAIAPTALNPADVPVDNVQATAFNGAQVTALKDLVNAVSEGLLPAESAIELMLVAFPITREVALRMVGPAEKLANEKKKDTPAAPESNPAGVLQEPTDTGTPSGGNP